MGGKGNLNKAQDALQPKNFSSPFGTMTFSGKNATYSPTFFPGQQDILNTAPQNEANLLKNNLPQTTDMFQGALNNYVGKTQNLSPDMLYNNNPFYQNAMQMYTAPFMRQYQQDSAQLANNMNAQHQTGNSYAALKQNLLDQNRDYNLNQAVRKCSPDSWAGLPNHAGPDG